MAKERLFTSHRTIASKEYLWSVCHFLNRLLKKTSQYVLQITNLAYHKYNKMLMLNRMLRLASKMRLEPTTTHIECEMEIQSNDQKIFRMETNNSDKRSKNPAVCGRYMKSSIFFCQASACYIQFNSVVIPCFCNTNDCHFERM